MHRRPIYVAILVAVLASIAIAGVLSVRTNGGNTPTVYEKADSVREIDPRIAAQMPLADAASQIHELWQTAELQGFTGIRLDNARREVVLYWKGQVPPTMAALVQALRASVPVRVVDRRYSLSELQGEARRLVELDLAGTGVNVVEAGPLPDFSGIRVGIETTEQLDKAQGIDRARQVIRQSRNESHVVGLALVLEEEVTNIAGNARQQRG